MMVNKMVLLFSEGTVSETEDFNLFSKGKTSDSLVFFFSLSVCFFKSLNYDFFFCLFFFFSLTLSHVNGFFNHFLEESRLCLPATSLNLAAMGLG